MAKKKNQGPFLVEGMTVSQILNLGDDVNIYDNENNVSKELN